MGFVPGVSPKTASHAKSCDTEVPRCVFGQKKPDPEAGVRSFFLAAKAATAAYGVVIEIVDSKFLVGS